jgi:tRNA modification GTPase
MSPLDDTIAAIASPPGGAARGIVRISGPQAVECLRTVSGGADLLVCQEECGSSDRPESPPRNSPAHVVAGKLQLPAVQSPIPCDVYFWPQRSYTGQPVVELHTIGSPPLLQMLLRAVCAAGARLAGPGEFTLRAFLAGRIDLTQAEAVLGVIDAADGPALDAALGQLAGGLARPLHRLRDALLDLLAHVEAGFDFADEDLPFVTRAELDQRLATAESHILALERQMASRAAHVDAMQVVLVGRPNAGKSSLFNALVGSSSALVSHQPGTTRDYLTAEIDLAGMTCRVIDTAGIDERQTTPHAKNAVAHAAQNAADSQRHAAHVEVLCLDSTRPLDDWERREINDEQAAANRIIVLTKCDAMRTSDTSVDAIATSSRTGQGLAELRDELRCKALSAADAHGNVVAATAVRCRESLRLAAQSLQQARSVAATGQEELAAVELRVALVELGKVVGAVYTDDILDRIFSRFCIGK